jgi:phenylacetate-CoA ligase
MAETDIPQINPEEKRQLQLERLQSTLNRAYKNVPFHQNRLRTQGIDPLQIQQIEDLSQLPFMTRTDLGEHYPYGLFAVPLRDIVRIHSAPGPLSNPTISGYTQQDLSTWRKIVARALKAAGVTPHDILQISFDPALANWAIDYKNGAEAIEAGVIPNTPLSIEKQIMIIRDYKTSVMITTPDTATQLAEQMYTSGLNPIGLNLRTLILVGEPVPESVRRHLEEKLHVTTWLHYGLSEVPGPAIGFECDCHNGLHIHDDLFLCEVIDPSTGDVQPAGKSGELVLTTLSIRAFPLIRFRTGDRVRITTEPCPCGSSALKIQWLPRRIDDLININGVKVQHHQLRLHLEKALGFSPEHCRFFKQEQVGKTYLEVWISMDQRLFSDEIKNLEKLIHSVEAKLTENLGAKVMIRLKERHSFSDTTP